MFLCPHRSTFLLRSFLNFFFLLFFLPLSFFFPFLSLSFPISFLFPFCLFHFELYTLLYLFFFYPHLGSGSFLKRLLSVLWPLPLSFSVHAAVYLPVFAIALLSPSGS